jgi:hypothetical protein
MGIDDKRIYSLGMFKKWQKTTITFVMSAHLHGTTGLLLD